jgi:hypothetical protein
MYLDAIFISHHCSRVMLSLSAANWLGGWYFRRFGVYWQHSASDRVAEKEYFWGKNNLVESANSWIVGFDGCCGWLCAGQ